MMITFNIRNKKVLALTLVAVITVACFLCSHPNHMRPLASIDSLIVKNEFHQALDSLQLLDKTKLHKGEQAYYNLLLTQAKYKSHILANSDSDINLAVNYYSQSNDVGKYVRALVYQGCVNEGLGDYYKAVICFCHYIKS